MEQTISNYLNSERSVEVIFVENTLKKYYKQGDTVLDIGGVPTNGTWLSNFYSFIRDNKIDYRVSDFRQCDYPGDFVQINFGDQKFDIGIFLSSLEHFPQCTESDVVFREGYDRKGYEKALSILNDGGYIFLTVPFGKHVWQPYHQNYNWQGILDLTKGSKIIESYTYRLINNEWVITDPNEMEDVLYTDKAFGVGCFVLQKD